MSGRRVYVDLDDCVAETTSRFPALVEELFGIRRSFDEIHTFHLDRAFGLTREQLGHLFHHVHDERFLIELDPREGALAVMAEWHEAGHEIRIVTGRPPASRAHSIEWLERKGVPHHHFHLCDKYGRFPAEDSDLSLEDVRELDFDVAVEDSLEMAAQLADWGIEQVLLLDRPWNRAEKGQHEGVVRVRCWQEIRERVEV